MLNEILVFSFCYAVLAFVWVAILVQPYGFLDFIPKLFQKAPERVIHVLFQCEKCLAGQLSLWTYPVLTFFYFHVDYYPLAHFLVILFSIFFAAFIGKIYERL